MTADTESNAVSTIQIPRQQRIKLHTRMGDVRTEVLNRSLTAPAPACPDLGGGFARIHEEHEALSLLTMGKEQSHCVGLIKPGQVPEIAVLAKRPLRVRMMCDQSRGRDHRRDSTQLSHETLAAVREKLGIKNRGKISHGRDRAPEKRQDGSQSARA